MFWVLLLLPAWVVAGLACTRLCLAAVRAADAAETAGTQPLTLYEAAFLSGGPTRVADLTLVSMARQRRLLLAHTGWATVVDPRGRDDIERSVIGAIGPQGQSPIAPVRAAAAATDAVHGLADRLVSAGLALPAGAGSAVGAGVRRVRLAALTVLALGVAALLMPAQDGVPRHLVALWFALPLVLCLSCLALARIEAHPYSRWASPAGQRLLDALARHADGTGDDRAYLTSVAVRGIRAVGEPDLRAAFAHRESSWRV
ncbi:TIGR04222 domain-containing membrane protein [Streptomyces chromofuscus]|uniref:TIGR04222 domain-containing membrane protein n=1 Tax=Streptomyces chromofuscus TaxID=42881 RepID=A0A7M2T6R9_STRCW|nr:TIGR04222 domain-containing membrane protein [Streptomyces chromofuscus]QOV43595.1 TIGR04222 domain-containing membrane protein [Streptomyces chromofuscus]GGT10754.1 membrane protein [Streptomyces chromofuscus]